MTGGPTADTGTALNGAGARPRRRPFRRRTAALLVMVAVLVLRPAPSAADEPAPKLVDPSLTYDGALLGDLAGGVRRGVTGVGNLHLKLAVDGNAIGMPGLSAYLDVLTVDGGRPVSRVGDAQGVSNLAGPNGTQVEELWLEYDFAARAASVLAGIYDLNSEFYRLRAAGLFLAAPFGIGTDFAQSGANGPSIFPRTSAGLRFAVKPSAGTVLRVALLDGVPVVREGGSRAVFKDGDGTLLVGEWALLSRPDPAAPGPTHARNRIGRLSTLPGYEDKLAIGAWRYSGRFADVGDDTDAAGEPLMRGGSSGAYLVCERLMIGDVASAGRRLSAFLQAGVADPRVNRFASYLGAGLVGTGWVPTRPTDEIGVALAHARNGSHILHGLQASTGVPAHRAETIVEVTWLTALGDHLTVQPALQRVVHPNTDPAIRSAWVAQLRVEVGY